MALAALRSAPTEPGLSAVSHFYEVSGMRDETPRRPRHV